MQDNYGNECAETVAELRRELAAVKQTASGARAEMFAAQRHATAMQVRAERAEAERDELRAWKEAVSVAVIRRWHRDACPGASYADYFGVLLAGLLMAARRADDDAMRE